jgi:hypothetical protein
MFLAMNQGKKSGKLLSSISLSDALSKCKLKDVKSMIINFVLFHLILPKFEVKTETSLEEHCCRPHEVEHAKWSVVA